MIFHRRADSIVFNSGGTNPFICDECGRTPLDLAFLMVEDLIVTALCTSFPVDFLLHTLEYDAKYPAKFVPNYQGIYDTLYDHPQEMRLRPSHHFLNSKDASVRYKPVPFPSYKHETLPRHAYDHFLRREPAAQRQVWENPEPSYPTALAIAPKESLRRRSVPPSRVKREELPAKRKTQSKTGPHSLDGRGSSIHRGSSEEKPKEGPKETRSKEFQKTRSTQKQEKQTMKGTPLPARSRSIQVSNRSPHKKEKRIFTTLDPDDTDYEDNVLPSDINDPKYFNRDFSAFRPPNATVMQRLFQDQMLVVVEDAIQNTTTRQAQRRMTGILSQLKALLRIIALLCTSEPLRLQAIEYRLLIARPSFDDDQKPCFVLENLTFPYLYLATLQNLFEMYPYGPSQEPWEGDSVADARRLFNIVLHKRLKGHEVVHFLSELPQYILQYIRTLGFQFFRPPSDLAQFLMHYAFCTDSPDLFYFSSRASQPFRCRDLFHWDGLIQELLKHTSHFTRFLIPLVSCRLKERLHRRFASEAPHEDASLDQDHEDKHQPRSRDLMPFDESMLTQDFIHEFARIFGTRDLPQLEHMLRSWRYDIARMQQGAPAAMRPLIADDLISHVVDFQQPPPPVPRYLRPKQPDQRRAL